MIEVVAINKWRMWEIRVSGMDGERQVHTKRFVAFDEYDDELDEGRLVDPLWELAAMCCGIVARWYEAGSPKWE